MQRTNVFIYVLGDIKEKNRGTCQGSDFKTLKVKRLMGYSVHV